MNFNYQGIYGYDVSLWQDVNSTPQQIDFKKMKSSGATFCGVKVGQGFWSDPDFTYNWKNSKEAGLVRFGYWFCDENVKPKVQAQKYWELLQLDFDQDEMQWADYENGSWDWYQLYIFMNEFQRLSGLPDYKMGIYTGTPYWTAHSPLSSFYREYFARHPLWLAWYTGSPAYVKVPVPFTEALLWQDGTPPSIGTGVESPTIDHDMFNGDTAKFKYYFGSSAVITPPQPEPIQKFPSSVFIDDKQYRGGA
jgi:GH25 family lysozyme M1 (1,4-beta-N-acetylmuramidase)